MNNYNKRIIWVFWGQKARKIGEQCGIQETSNQILVSAHPSPYSAEAGFFGSRPFSKVNQLLLKLERGPIEWGKIC
ncbi:MAG: hypothetical protein I3273_02230 [Candidatus Moeniiplasma glomeromycotorum]|nr:hypothetical protein [Candidatus Moeniiplasma glomeromycotorum]MCE8167065.1 hypothetical protein [Candidatus Moeniiplasma glomeromycotorum]MCE8168923.1 hypothetical protein [Candidatus Moeniiplasma glomeromycotorum]